MRTRQNAVDAALLRVKRFFAEYETQLMSAVDFTVARQRLDDVIASFTTHAVNQDGNRRSAKGETEKQLQLRLLLRTEVMQPIAEIARRSLRTVPEFKALQMPPRSAKGAAFIASATAMADAAVLHKAALLARGLPADSLDQFQASLAQLLASVSDREQNRTHRMGATKGLSIEEQEARSVLKVLDALVRRALRGNEALLMTWAGARQIYGRPRKVATPSSTTAATPVETTVTAPSSPAAPAA